MSKKSKSSEPAINTKHDPLSWLLQDKDEAPPPTENINTVVSVTQVVDKQEHKTQPTEAENTETPVTETGKDIECCSGEKINEADNMNDEKTLAMQAEEDEIQEEIQQATALSEDTVEADGEATAVSDDNAILILDEDISIVHVAALKQAWLPLIDSRKNITIEAQQVEDIDTAGLQLLLSFVKTVRSSGRQIQWNSPSETLIRAVTETDLKDVMGCVC